MQRGEAVFLFIRESYRPSPVGIVVTKCDLIPKQYQTAIQEIIGTQFEDIIEEKGSGCFTHVSNTGWKN